MEIKTIFRAVKFFLFAGIIVSGYVLLRFSRCSEYLEPERMKNFIASWGSSAPLIFIGISAFRPIILFPASILTVVAGILFGTITGTLYAVFGSTLGAVVAYFFSKLLGSGFVHLLFGNQLLRIESPLHEQGMRIIFFLRLIPIIPFDLVNYASGLVKVNFFNYLTGTFLGLIPATFAYTFLGESLKKLYSFQFFLSILVFILLIYLPYVYEKKRNRDGRPSILDIKRGKDEDD
jgi:uncharacterized membrane protein YdjX (TVP38/TMEM64 family)